MHRENFQIGMAFEHAVEDQIMQRDGGFERIADHVVEIKPGQPFCVREAIGVNDDEGAKLFRLLPERRMDGIRKLAAGHVGEDFRSLHAELFHAALELVGGFRAVDHRHAAEREEPVGLLGDVFRKPIVDHLRGLDRNIERHGVVALVRRRQDELQIDAHGVEVREPLVVAGDPGTDILVLLLAQCLRRGVGKMAERDCRGIEMRLYERRRLRNRHVGMDVDGGARRPYLAPGLAVPARGRALVFVPLLGHAISLLRLARCVADYATLIRPTCRYPHHQKTPRCCDTMASSSLIPLAAPRKTTLPVLMITISSARSSVSLMFCSTSTID